MMPRRNILQAILFRSTGGAVVWRAERLLHRVEEEWAGQAGGFSVQEVEKQSRFAGDGSCHVLLCGYRPHGLWQGEFTNLTNK